MALQTIIFNVSSEQQVIIREAFEWQADRLDPDNSPHSFDAAELAGLVRTIMLNALRGTVKRIHERKGESTRPSYPDIDDIE